MGFHSYTEPMLSTDNEMVRGIVLAVMASLAKIERQKISERTPLQRKNMTAANYQHIGGHESRLGRHYSRFSTFWSPAALPINDLLCENRRAQGRMGEVGLVAGRRLERLRRERDGRLAHAKGSNDRSHQAE